MCPLSDEALLDWALAPAEADPEVERHLRECPSCRDRSRAVLREQDHLRIAFTEPAPLPRLELRLGLHRPAPAWSRVGVAALILVTIAVGILLTGTADRASHRPR